MGADAVDCELGRRTLGDFARALEPELQWTPFHRTYYQLLNEFARGTIRRMIVSVPPQHGKSHGASVVLPAYLLGCSPALRVTIASYSFGLARRFGQEVQRLMSEEVYGKLFPETRLKGIGEKSERERTARRTSEEFDCVGKGGGLRTIGRNGSLTGNRVDVVILDDLYKDALEANSPLIRDRVWEWYNAVVRTRLHNDSRELIVCTRWHEEDLIGRIKKEGGFLELTDWGQLDGLTSETWVSVNFEALKRSEPVPVDPRRKGEALWPERHSVRLLESRRRSDPPLFEALYQGNPTVREGLLYSRFETYGKLPDDPVKIANYTDTADTGMDKLCSVCYVVGRDGLIYVTDLLYTPEPMEVTEIAVAGMLERGNIPVALFESNNGGRGFARAVSRLVGRCEIRMFHQKGNKESRILTHSSTVTRMVRMPEDWKVRWPEFAADLESFRRAFHANAHDDAPDTLTGIVETESAPAGKRIRHVHFVR